MDIEKFNTVKEHFQLISFAAAAPIFMLIAAHIISCKFSYIMNSLSIVKLTWAFISFLGRENLGIQNTIKRFIISALLIFICFFEMTNRQYFLEKPYMIGVDFFFTFISLAKYYFQWINYFLKVGGILENAYLIQTTITSVAVWKTYDPTVQDRMLPFALAYTVSAIYYAIFYIIQFYIIQKGKRLASESEPSKKEEALNNKEEDASSKNEKAELDPDDKKSETKTQKKD